METSSDSPPAFSTAPHGSISSTSSTPSVTRKAIRLPVSSLDIMKKRSFRLILRYRPAMGTPLVPHHLNRTQPTGHDASIMVKPMGASGLDHAGWKTLEGEGEGEDGFADEVGGDGADGVGDAACHKLKHAALRAVAQGAALEQD